MRIEGLHLEIINLYHNNFLKNGYASQLAIPRHNLLFYKETAPGTSIVKKSKKTLPIIFLLHQIYKVFFSETLTVTKRSDF